MTTKRHGWRFVVAALLAIAAPAVAETPRERSAEALRTLERAAGAPLRIERSPATGLATFVAAARGASVPSGAAASATARERALSFADRGGAAFGITGRSEVQVRSASAPDEIGVEHVRLQQVHEGVVVRGGELVVHLRGSGVTAANGRALAAANEVSTKPTLSAESATAVAQELVRNKLDAAAATLSAPKLEILDAGFLQGRPSGAHLTWFIEATDLALRERIWIDANDGSIVLSYSQITDALSRQVYSANDTMNLPGTLVRGNGAPSTGDDDVDTAYDYSTDTYNYYSTQHGRDSYDNAGATLTSTVHYCEGGCPYANAFWNGTQMVYGEGFSLADDVDAHELTHAVTEYSANLDYCLQSGALNESFSDIFGETVDLTNGAGTDTGGVRWLMGEDVPIGAIRDMMNPNAFGDPARLSDTQFFCATSCFDFDNGGVHINSGVPNHAYALMVDGGTYNGHTVTGIGLTKAGKIQYRSLTHYLTSTSLFIDDYNALQQSCSDLIGTAGITAGDCAQVLEALDAVELGEPVCPPPPVCGDGQTNGNEQCDDGGLVDGDGCDSNCTFTACGNGVTTSGEICDDGNLVSGDGCEPDCTITPGCAFYHSTDVPKAILDVATITSTMTIAPVGPILHVGVTDLAGTHTYTGDLRFTLTSPSNTSVVIVDRVCGGNDDFDLNLDDLATSTIQCPATDGQTHLPANPLSTFDGEPAAGTWTLTIEDLAGADVGILQSWGLFVCSGLCGNGVIDDGETCDDGNHANGDCCSSICNYDAPGAACTSDGNACSVDTCDGAGVCQHVAGNGGGTCRAAASSCDLAETCDGSTTICPADVFKPSGAACGDSSDTTCTDPDACDGLGLCEAHNAPNGTPCDDASICTQTDQCAGGVCAGSNPIDCDDGDLCTQDSCAPLVGCVNDEAPRNTCLGSGKSFLQLKKNGGTSDRLVWKWLRGAALNPANFGAPLTSTDYSLCIYDGNGLMMSASAPAGSLWRLNANGAKYRDSLGGSDGVTNILLRAGAATRSRTIFKGKGAALGVPSLGGQVYPLTAQLVNSDTNTCMETVFPQTSVLVNLPTQLKLRTP